MYYLCTVRICYLICPDSRWNDSYFTLNFSLLKLSEYQIEPVAEILSEEIRKLLRQVSLSLQVDYLFPFDQSSQKALAKFKL